MKPSFLCCLLLMIWPAVGVLGAEFDREETLVLFEGRRVVVAVPHGFVFASGRDNIGVVRVRMHNAKENVSVELSFLPDLEERFADGYERNRFMYESFNAFAESSVEKAMQFEDLRPKVGAGTYCIFTDTKLVGQTTFPPGEYLHATKGVKVWPGVLVVFSIFSNETKSDDFQAALAVLRESVTEKAVPLR